MLRINVLLSMLCAACVLAVVLAKPSPARADDGTTPEPAPAAPTVPTGATQPLPVVHAPRRRTTQLHVPFGNLVAGFAKKLVGTRYVYGGTSPRTGFDCSGFVRYVYAHFGLALPHSSYAQYALGRRVARSALRPGDLVFFDGLGHVGMYIGNGQFVHAPHTGDVVRISSLDEAWYAANFVGARRIL